MPSNNKSFLDSDNTPYENGEVSLHLAVRSNKVDIVKRLLELGANANARNNRGRTPLHLAVEAKSKAVFWTLLHHRATNLNARMKNGDTPLILASRCGRKQHVVDLINAGACVNLANNKEQTALHCAVQYGCKKDIVDVLLENGATVDARDEEGRTPLHLVAFSNRPHLGMEVTANYLIMAGADVNALDDNGKTALHCAADFSNLYDSMREDDRLIRKERALTVEELLDAGADANAWDNLGNTPLHIAVETEAMAVFKVLVNHRKTNLNAHRLIDGKTPLLMLFDTAFMIDDGAFRALVNFGVDITAVDDGGKAALHYASKLNEIRYIHKLLQLGADIDVQDGKGQTPLYLAVRQGGLEACRVLLSKFANRDIANNRGKLPKDVAREMQHLDIVMLLNKYMPAG